MENLKFRILTSFWFLFAFALLIKQSYIFGLYTLSVLIHESAHCFVAQKLGYRCKSMALSAFGAVLYGDFDNVDNADGIKIALAGPAVNLIFAVIFVAVWWVFPAVYVFSQPFVACNLSLCLVNLLPAYPLDGGRILVSILSRKKQYAAALKVSRIVALCLSFALFVLFVVLCIVGINNFSLGLFAVFLFSSGMAEPTDEVFGKQIIFEGYKKHLKRGVERKTLVFDKQARLKSVVRKMSHNYVYCIEVVDNDAVLKKWSHGDVVKFLSENALDTPLEKLL